MLSARERVLSILSLSLLTEQKAIGTYYLLYPVDESKWNKLLLLRNGLDYNKNLRG